MLSRREFLVGTVSTAIDVSLGHVAEAESTQREKRVRPFATQAGSIVELNKGDSILLWGSRIIAQGEPYSNIILGALAKDEIGSNADVVDFDGFRFGGSSDLQMIWLPRISGDISKQIEALKTRMASKAAMLMIPQGSARFLNGVIIELSQVDLISQIRTFVNAPFYWSRS